MSNLSSKPNQQFPAFIANFENLMAHHKIKYTKENNLDNILEKINQSYSKFLAFSLYWLRDKRFIE